MARGDWPSRQIGVQMRFALPAAPLKDLITSYYTVEVRGPPGEEVHDMLHPEWGNIRFALANAWDTLDAHGRPVGGHAEVLLFGPTSRARGVVARPGAIQGTGFTPLGWATLIGLPADELADRVVDARDRIGPGLAELAAALRQASDDAARTALLDAFWTARAERDAPREAVIRAIGAALLDPAVRTVEGFAERVGVSQAALARACQRHFGFTPKLLLQRQRFMRTLAALAANPGRPIGDLIDPTYVDHSHFNRDFKRFMGLSPRDYLAQPRLVLRAATGERERALGAALQGLHEL